MDEFYQDFHLSYKPETYADKTGQQAQVMDKYFGLLPVKFNVFNITSFASEYLVKRMKYLKNPQIEIHR